MLGVYGHRRDAVLREPDQSRIPVAREIDPSQILIHYLGEHPLAVTDHDQFARRLTLGGVAGVLGIVVENLGPVGIQPPAGECVCNAEFAGEDVNGGPDALHGHARLTERGKSICLAETDERHRCIIAVFRADCRDNWPGRSGATTVDVPLVTVGPRDERGRRGTGEVKLAMLADPRS